LEWTFVSSYDIVWYIIDIAKKPMHQKIYSWGKIYFKLESKVFTNVFEEKNELLITKF